MPFRAADLAEKLAANVEAVCAHYLSNGRRAGRYWLIGDVMNTPGQSLHVRLAGPLSGPGAAGKWSDEATGEHGDLLDLIRLNQHLDRFAEVRDEVLRFLREPGPPTRPVLETVPKNSSAAARRLFAASGPIQGSVAATYLGSRGLAFSSWPPTLRFHPECYYRPMAGADLQRWPALIAGITDTDGVITGVLRTYLARDGSGKAPLGNPRLAMGALNGNAVRFGTATDAVIVGEGIETMLSVKAALPWMPVAAALTANHVMAFEWGRSVRRLYVAADNDGPGLRAAAHLAARAETQGIAVAQLVPRGEDWNAYLVAKGVSSIRQGLMALLDPADCPRDSC